MLRVTNIPGDNYFFIHDRTTLEALVNISGTKDLKKGKLVLQSAIGIDEVSNICTLDLLHKRTNEEISRRQGIRDLHRTIFERAIERAMVEVRRQVFNPDMTIQTDAIYYALTKSGLIDYINENGSAPDALLMAMDVIQGKGLQTLLSKRLNEGEWHDFLISIKRKFRDGLERIYLGPADIRHILHSNYRDERLYWLAKMFEELDLKKFKTSKFHIEVAKLASRIQTDWINGKIGLPKYVVTLFEDLGIECCPYITKWDFGGIGPSLLYPNEALDNYTIGGIYGLLSKRKFDLADERFRIGTRASKEDILSLFQNVGRLSYMPHIYDKTYRGKSTECMDIPEQFRRIYNAIDPNEYAVNPIFAKAFLHWYFKTAGHKIYFERGDGLQASMNRIDEPLVRKCSETVGLNISAGCNRKDRQKLKIVYIQNPSCIDL